MPYAPNSTLFFLQRIYAELKSREWSNGFFEEMAEEIAEVVRGDRDSDRPRFGESYIEAIDLGTQARRFIVQEITFELRGNTDEKLNAEQEKTVLEYYHKIRGSAAMRTLIGKTVMRFYLAAACQLNTE
ncbi:MAG: hypothetical protein Q8R25_04485 [bacterium]|nr:hypothetical protein [bacterium]